MKLAVFTPLNPARSGISDYSETLLPELAKHARIEAFVDGSYEPEGFGPGVDIPIRDHREFNPAEFDETLYQFGNNPYHVYIYDQALRHPGVALMHEFNMHHLFADVTIKRDDWDGYMAGVAYEGDEADVEYSLRVRELEVGPDYEGLPMNRRILEASKAALVHSRFMAGKLRENAPNLPIVQIPHGAWIPEVNRHQFRDKLGLDETNPLIGVFGFLKPYKRIRESLQAMRRLVRVEPRARMILVGEEHPEFPVTRMIDDMGLAAHVRVLGYTPIEDFVQYMGACDICLNLRYPTVGETSGTLLRALGLGRAAIVSDVGSFSDFPDEICLKVPVEGGEVDLLFEYLNLLVTKPEVRRALGAAARQWVAEQCDWASVGKRFVEALKDPVAAAARVEFTVAPSPAAAQEGSRSDTQTEDSVDVVANPPADESAATKTVAAASEPIPTEKLAADIRAWCHDRPDDATYVETHLTRLVKTLEMTPPGGPEDAVLEMGAYMHVTPALSTNLGYGEVRGCYLGPVGEIDHRRVTTSSGGVFECEVDLFNAETDAYPYPDERFTTVLCCELLEHLYEDPMHLMSEVNRILKPGGWLLLSTPNTCSLRAVQAALLGYHPGLFHHYVIPNEKGERDPRHAREYAPRDVQALFQAAGFEVERMETGAYLDRSSMEYDWIRRLLDKYELPQNLREDSVFALGRKTGPVQARYPAALYAGGH